MADADNLLSEIESFEVRLTAAKSEFTRRFTGHERVVDLTLSGLFRGGHGLLIGRPCLG